MRIEALIDCYPFLYHMAEANTWAHIQRFGLLSTSAILDLHNLSGSDRVPYESMQRPDMMRVVTSSAPTMILRDQKPMPDDRIKRALRNSMLPRDWYELLNRKVFFWATEERLFRLLGAKFYRAIEHDVLTIDSRSFLSCYWKKVELCHMNSGNTFPLPHPRDASIFKPASMYPAKPNGAPLKEVAEVTVPYSVPDVADHVVSVRRMRGRELINIVYERP